MPAPRMIRPLFSDWLAETSADSSIQGTDGRDMAGTLLCDNGGST
jgi:hypothetical protein